MVVEDCLLLLLNLLKHNVSNQNFLNSPVAAPVMIMMLTQSMFFIGCVAVACQNKSGLYLITAGFLHKHSYERKHFAVVSINRHQLQGDFVPWLPDQGLCPWTPMGAQPPDSHCGPPFPFQKYFWPNLLNKLCTPSVLPPPPLFLYSIPTFTTSLWNFNQFFFKLQLQSHKISFKSTGKTTVVPSSHAYRQRDSIMKLNYTVSQKSSHL